MSFQVVTMPNSSSVWVNDSQLSSFEDQLLVMYLLIIWIIAIYANGIIVFGLGLQKRPLQALDILMKNLAFSNGLLALLTFPMMVVSLFAHKWIFGEAGCFVYGFLTMFFGLVSVWTLVGIAGVLHCIIRNKSNAMTDTNKKEYRVKTQVFLVFIYILNFMLSLFPLVGVGSYGFGKHGTSCTINWQLRTTSSLIYLVILFALGFFVPMIAILKIYTFMITTLGAHNKQHSNPNFHQRWAAVKRRLLMMALCVAICMVICWTPYTCVALWEVFFWQSHAVPVALEAVAAFLGKSSTVLTPLVHLWFTKKYRRWFKQCLCCCFATRQNETIRRWSFKIIESFGSAGAQVDLHISNINPADEVKSGSGKCVTQSTPVVAACSSGKYLEIPSHA